MLTKTHESAVSAVLTDLGEALAAGDIDRTVALFAEDCYWRDLLTFTWNLKTVEGHAEIRDMLEHQLAGTNPTGFALDPRYAVETDGDITKGFFTFETALARGEGYIRVRNGKIFTLLTTMESLKGHEETVGERRPLGARHGQGKKRPSWLEERQAEDASLGTEVQPYVVIIGGGQGGIALGARLKQLGVSAIILEKNAKAGDSWRNRYKSLALHDPVWYDHLPYMDFPKNWPVFAPKDKMGDFLEMYTKIMELNYWTSSTCKSASFDEASKTWTVVVDRDGAEVVLKPTHLVFATGMSAKPNKPTFKGMDRFRGEQHHSSAHPGPDAYAGKRVVIVGSNNSAHDIAASLWEHDADVTMIQRSPTHVVRSDTLMELGLGPLYSEKAARKGITTHKADMIFASWPYAIMHEHQKELHDRIRAHDKDFYDRLAASGFQLHWGDDESGIQMLYVRRGSGYYIDIGASELIASGEIKVVPGDVDEITETGVRLTSGEELPADLIVYATGYGSMNGFVADLVSQEMADKVGKVWGLGSGTYKDPGPWEGEPRNMWKPTAQENLWFHGGNLHQSRHYSQFLAIQLKARMEGIETPVYGVPPVHHTS